MSKPVKLLAIFFFWEREKTALRDDWWITCQSDKTKQRWHREGYAD